MGGKAQATPLRPDPRSNPTTRHMLAGKTARNGLQAHIALPSAALPQPVMNNFATPSPLTNSHAPPTAAAGRSHLLFRRPRPRRAVRMALWPPMRRVLELSPVGSYLVLDLISRGLMGVHRLRGGVAWRAMCIVC